jgi:AcrR family transcriptional regulator
MPRPRFEKLLPERRDQILQSAAQEFARHGYDGASLNRILAATGVSKGAAYYYFDDKADLFATVVRRYMADALGLPGLDLSRWTRRTFWEEVFALYHRALTEMKKSPWSLGLAKSIWRLSREARAQGELAAIFQYAHDFLTGLIERGQQVGAVRTDIPQELLISMMFALDGAWDQWFLEHLDSMTPRDADALVMTLVGVVRGVFEPPARPSAATRRAPTKRTRAR